MRLFSSEEDPLGTKRSLTFTSGQDGPPAADVVAGHVTGVLLGQGVGAREPVTGYAGEPGSGTPDGVRRARGRVGNERQRVATIR